MPPLYSYHIAGCQAQARYQVFARRLKAAAHVRSASLYGTSPTCFNHPRLVVQSVSSFVDFSSLISRHVYSRCWCAFCRRGRHWMGRDHGDQCVRVSRDQRHPECSRCEVADRGDTPVTGSLPAANVPAYDETRAAFGVYSAGRTTERGISELRRMRGRVLPHGLV